ncbi:MAG: glycosyltransferase family 39 protein [Anaerolineae bacterium]|nr:glycosyltransferase family 39 protein [Anaerolineae bacterium]
MVPPQTTRFFLIVITLFSFCLRLWGIQFGLPFAYHPDEQQYILPAIGVVSGNFQPLAYYNPTLYPYFIGVVYTLTYAGLKLFNAFPAFFDLNAAWSEPMLPWITGLVYLARYTSVAMGVLTTLMVYHLGRRAYSRETGLGAAIIFGLAFLPAREAHFAVSDAPVALGAAVTLYFCLNIVKRAHPSDYLWAGLTLGLSAATKYSAGLLALPLGAAHLLSQRYQHWPERLRRLWLVGLAGLIAIASYLLVSPYTLWQREEFWADFSENLQSAQTGFLGLDLDPAGGAFFYLKGLIWGFGWPLFVLFLVAGLFALWRHRRADLVLFALPLIGFFYLQRQEMYFVRWLTPLLPPMAVLAAETIWVGVKRWSFSTLLRFVQNDPWPKFLGLLVMLLLTLPSTYVALCADHVFSQLDTRTEALHWISQNIPPGSNLAAAVLAPPWGPPLAMPGLKIGPYNFVPVPDGGVAEVDLQQYRAWGVQYVIASSFHYARPLRDKAHQAQLAARMQALDENAALIALFQPYVAEYDGFFYHDQVFGPADDTLYRRRPGPIIKIYRLP